MIPGVNPRQLKQMMRQMGMSQTDIDAVEVLIKTFDGKTMIFENPSVQKVVMQGQESYQVVGSPTRIEEEKLEVKISKEDIELVAEQAKVSEEKAREALERTNGDIAEAIVKLS